MALEDFGICKPGEAGQFVAAGNLRWPHGKLPSNTSGGLLSEGYVHGRQRRLCPNAAAPAATRCTAAETASAIE